MALNIKINFISAYNAGAKFGGFYWDSTLNN